MSETTETAQERLQQQSLRNVRALIEKLEGEEKRSRESWKGLLVAAMVITVLLVGGVFGIGSYVRGTRPVPAAVTIATAAATLPEYQERLRRQFEAHANGARADAWRQSAHGPAVLKIVMERTGRVGEVTIERGSGDSVTDSHYATLLKQAEPFGILPPGSGGEVTFLATVSVDRSRGDPGVLHAELATAP